MVDQLQLQERQQDEFSSVASTEGRRLLPRVAVTALMIGAAIGSLAGCSGDSADTPSKEMTEAVDAWVVAAEGQDAGDMVALYAEDAVWYDEALDDKYVGRDAIRRAYDAGFTGTDTVTVDELAVDSDTAVLRWSFVGPTHDLTGISVLEFDGPVIVAETLYYDCAQSPVPASCANM